LSDKLPTQGELTVVRLGQAKQINNSDYYERMIPKVNK